MTKINQVTFAQIFCMISDTPAAEHDLVVVHPEGATTRVVFSARGLGHVADKVVELQAPLGAIEIDLYYALKLASNWTISSCWYGEMYAHRKTSARPVALQVAA